MTSNRDSCLQPSRLTAQSLCAAFGHLFRRLHWTALLLLLAPAMFTSPAARAESEITFRRIPTQFIAALGDPHSTSGGGAETWGLWRVDPGPRGVWLEDFDKIRSAGGVAPARWQFDEADWWVDENGLLMEKPEFPVPPGRYVVTGDREAVAVLTIHEEDESGSRRWELDGATLFDVTHLPCRSARYRPATAGSTCSPVTAPLSSFPVSPGGLLPPVDGCHKLDYSVLFVIGIAVESS